MADEIVLPIPNLNLPQCLFLLSSPTQTHHHEKARKDLLDGIKADRKLFPFAPLPNRLTNENGIEMAPYLKQITSLPSSPLNQLDPSILSALEKANEEELAKLDARLEEAEKTEGESEISDALKARANYLTRIGDKVRSTSWVPIIMDPCVGLLFASF
jgi:26S proteasome regulatory subunit N7